LSEAQGESWSEEQSAARNHKSSYLPPSGAGQASSQARSGGRGGVTESQSCHGGFTDTSNGGGYQGGAEPTGAFHQTKEFKAEKDNFFGRKQSENAMKRDDVPPSQARA
jgi:hypothetical protein